MTSWSSVVTQWTLAGLYAQKSQEGIGNLLGTETGAMRDGLVQTVGINPMADLYRQRLIQKFRQDFPDDLASMQTFMQGRIGRIKEFQTYADAVSGVNDVNRPFAPMGMEAYPQYSSLIEANDGIYGIAVQNRPRLFLVAAPVTNALLAGEAERGEFIGIASSPTDGSDPPASSLYINQGSKTSPNWVAFDDDSLIDFIINPTELLTCGYRRTMFNIKAYAIDVPKGTDLQWGYTFLPPAMKLELADIEKLEDAAFALLRPSLDGTGIVTDFVRQSNKRKKAFF